MRSNPVRMITPGSHGHTTWHGRGACRSAGIAGDFSRFRASVTLRAIMQSKAATVAEYLAELPPDRRAAISAVRKVILKNLDAGYEEGMMYGMICYFVPYSIYPPGYHCKPAQPLPYAALASQKNYMSVYVATAYENDAGEKWLRHEWAKSGKKLDMGKCCIRFRKLEDLALDVIAEAFRRSPVKEHIAHYEQHILTKNKAGARAAEKRKAAAAVEARGPASRKAVATRRNSAAKR